jgi:amino acid adenylation domain-containing protein
MTIPTEASNKKMGLTAAKLALLQKKLSGHMVNFTQITKRPTDQIVLSYAQQRLWFLQQLEPHGTSYNFATGVRLTGDLDIPILEKSFNEIIRRHESFRTSIHSNNDQTTPKIAPEVNISIPITDLSGLSEPSRRECLREFIDQQSRRPFDLAVTPLLRLDLVKLAVCPDGGAEFFLLIIMHHIITDGWSAGILYHELVSLYQAYSKNLSSSLPELTVTYSDFAYWQKQWLQGTFLEKQLSFWKENLHDAPQILEFPTGRKRPPVQSYRGETIAFELPADLTESLKNLSRSFNITLYSTLLAAFNVLLYRYTGQADICVGVPVANRNRPEIEGLIGFFVNTLVIRSNLSGNPSFANLCKQTHQTMVQAQDHQDIPFELLVEKLQPTRDLSINPLFQVMFVLHNMPYKIRDIPGIKIEVVEIPNDTSKFDLLLHATENGAVLDMAFEYSVDLFDKELIVNMANNFKVLLDGIGTNAYARLSQLPLLAALEQQKLLAWSKAARNYSPAGCFKESFEEQVLKTPKNIAVIYGNRVLTYAELNSLSNRVAHGLLDRGVGTDDLIGILGARSIEFLVMIIGILKAGGAYLPLDPEYPPSRLKQIIDESQPKFILTDDDSTLLITKLVAQPGNVVPLPLNSLLCSFNKDTNPSIQIAQKSLAYVIYTSGSTGIPKGAMNTNLGLQNNIMSKLHWLNLNSDDSIAQTAPQCFDISVWQFLTALTCGACTHIVPQEIVRDPWLLLDFLDESGVTILEIVPSMMRSILSINTRKSLASLRWLLPTGEALPPLLCDEWLTNYPNIPLLNAYGPAECSDDAVLHPIFQKLGSDIVHVPIGRPNDNFKIYLLNPYKQLQPIGIPGEIYIGGLGVGRGYLHDSVRTADVFIPNPFSDESGTLLYKTGDLGKFLSNGTIEFLGRLDHQVKIRGFRVETGEIETRLLKHEDIREAAVGVIQRPVIGESLVAYVSSSTDQEINPSRLGEYLRAELPEYMVPSIFVQIEQLPKNSNGKIDRKRLNSINVTVTTGFKAEPRTPIEQILADIFSEVLGIDKPSIYDDFFQLGGHSLLAVQLMQRIRHRLYKNMALTTVFMAPTIAKLAHWISENPGEHPSSLIIKLRDGKGSPVYVIHHGGGTLHKYKALIDNLTHGFSLYGIQARYAFADIVTYSSIQEIAKEYVELIRHHSEGPYRILGWSFGGIVAFEIAKALEELGEKVSFLGIIDAGFKENLSYSPKSWREIAFHLTAAESATLVDLSKEECGELDKIFDEHSPSESVRLTALWGKEHGYWLKEVSEDVITALCRIHDQEMKLSYSARPSIINAPIHVWWASTTLDTYEQNPTDFRNYSHHPVIVKVLSGDHQSILENSSLASEIGHALSHNDMNHFYPATEQEAPQHRISDFTC